MKARYRDLSIACALALLSVGAVASGAVGSAGSDMQRLSEDDLAEQRGGFRWGGLDIRLGAEIRSYVGDALVMQTNLNWDDTNVQRTFSTNLASAAAANTLNGMLAVGSLRANQTGETVVIVNEGQTAFIHRTDGTIQNIILNTASNADLRQYVDARLDIGGYAPFRGDILAARIGAALSAMSGPASITAP